MDDTKQTVQIGDIFKSKPKEKYYQGQTLRVFNIRFTELQESEHRIDVKASDGSTDSYWRERFLDEFEKLNPKSALDRAKASE